MLHALKATGLCADRNLRPSDNQCLVIQILAGFDCASVQALERADGERERLAAAGIIIPRYHWGIPFPRHGLRRTALFMHLKLFGSLARTAEWAGYPKCRFWILSRYWRLVTKAETRKFWTMLPTHLQAEGIRVRLPSGNKLGSGAVADSITLVSRRLAMTHHTENL